MTRTLNARRRPLPLFCLHIINIIFHIIFLALFSYQTHKVMWYTSSNQNALQSSVSGDLALESIFLTTLRAQEWAQYGLNSCGLLRGWIEIALLYSSLTDSLYRKCCFLFIQMQRLCFSRESTRALCLSVGFTVLQRSPSWLTTLLINKGCWKTRYNILIVVMEYRILCNGANEWAKGGTCAFPWWYSTREQKHCIIMVVTKLPYHF